MHRILADLVDENKYRVDRSNGGTNPIGKPAFRDALIGFQKPTWCNLKTADTVYNGVKEMPIALKNGEIFIEISNMAIALVSLKVRPSYRYMHMLRDQLILLITILQVRDSISRPLHCSARSELASGDADTAPVGSSHAFRLKEETEAIWNELLVSIMSIMPSTCA